MDTPARGDELLALARRDGHFTRQRVVSEFGFTECTAIRLLANLVDGTWARGELRSGGSPSVTMVSDPAWWGVQGCGVTMIALVGSTQAWGNEGDEIVVASPVELTASDLGAVVDKDFRLLGGSKVVDGDPPIRTVGGETRAAWTVETNLDVVKAEARAWGGVFSAGAEGGPTRESTMAFFRSLQVDQVLLLEPGTALRSTLPPDAAWYVSAIYVGRTLEVACAGEETVLRGAIQAGASAVVNGAQVTLGGSSSHEQVQCSLRVLGMKARPGHEAASLVLASGAPTDENYIPDGDPRVVLVRYTRVPRPEGAPPASYTLLLADVAFPPTKPDGAAWDLFDGPDISVWVKVHDQIVWRSPIAEDTGAYSYRVIALPEVAATETNVAFTVVDIDMAENDPAGRVTLDLSQLHDVSPDGEVLQLTTTAGVRLSVVVVPTR